jgi:hypothetical protein
MFEQPLPFASHRRHWYEYVIGVELVHVPVEAVSVFPSCAVPEMIGSRVGLGAAELAAVEKPATARTVTSPAPSSGRSDLIFMR